MSLWSDPFLSHSSSNPSHFPLSAFALWRPGEAPPFPTPNRLLTLFCLGLEPPPDVTVPFNVSAAPGSTATLSCVVTSTVRFNLTWQRGGADVRLGARSRIASNLSLEIQRVTPDDAGWYGCIAANEGGVTASRVYLSVQCKCVLLLLYVRRAKKLIPELSNPLKPHPKALPCPRLRFMILEAAHEIHFRCCPAPVLHSSSPDV